MTLCQLLPTGNTGQFYGRIYVPEIASVTAISPYDIVQSDLSSNIVPESVWFGQTVYRLFFRVLEFDVNVIPQFGSALTRYKFGGYTMQNADCNYPIQFLTYVQQTSSKYVCLVTELDKPGDIVFEDCSSVNSSARQIGINTPYPSYAHYDYATDVIVQPAESVVVDCLITYTGLYNRDVQSFDNQDVIYINF